MDQSPYADLKTIRDISGYTLMRGTTDWSNLRQFDMYEKGYPFLVVVGIPAFLQEMCKDQNSEVAKLIKNYVHILEYEFRGLDSGLENLGTDNQEINSGNQSMQVITKTTGLTGGTFSMRYTERSGAPITRLHELYLRSVRDPASGFKHYNGLIGDATSSYADTSKAGFDQECFTFLYMHTDNTGLNLERAALIVGAQPTTAELSIYNGEKGNPEFAEVSAEFNGFPIMGSAVNKRAKEILNWIMSSANKNQAIRNSWNYDYTAIKSAENGGLAQAGLTK